MTLIWRPAMVYTWSHGHAAVFKMLPGFAIIWYQKQVTRQLHLPSPTFINITTERTSWLTNTHRNTHVAGLNLNKLQDERDKLLINIQYFPCLYFVSPEIRNVRCNFSSAALTLPFRVTKTPSIKLVVWFGMVGYIYLYQMEQDDFSICFSYLNMMTSACGNAFGITGSVLGHQWETLMFSFFVSLNICWANSSVAGDLRHLNADVNLL